MYRDSFANLPVRSPSTGPIPRARVTNYDNATIRRAGLFCQVDLQLFFSSLFFSFFLSSFAGLALEINSFADLFQLSAR